eukprot:TRINITY_DN4683_c0_g1_i1.p1 TRINITY_DN4683_c0_g1~~TRINITY_DN4683_c0_g1_i1.p1  ORF type:complete len:316 (-),score=66.72 TRINITY_DN4683_c0_g1_i1:871-1818(-)
MQLFVIVLYLCLVALVSVVSGQESINYTNPNGFAESVGYSALRNCFFIGAGINPPHALAIITRDGEVIPFVNDTRTSSSDFLTLGIKVNDDTSEIYFVVANATVAFGAQPSGGRSSIFVVADLNEGDVLQYTDLTDVGPGRLNANDVVYDGKNMFYITDAAGGRIISVSRQGDVSVFAQDSGFLPPYQGLFGIDGIVLVPDEYFIVNNFGTGRLYKVDFDGVVVEIPILNNHTLTHPDGMIWGPSGSILTIQNNPVTTVSQLASKDNWVTAQYIAEATNDHPSGSALVFAQSSLYISHSPYPFQAQEWLDVITLN